MPSNVTPELECLSQLTSVNLEARRNAFIGSSEKFLITDSHGERLFHAEEVIELSLYRETAFLKINDMNGKNIIKLMRPAPCQLFCFFCSSAIKTVKIQSPPGKLAGTVEQEVAFARQPQMYVKNGNGNLAFSIKQTFSSSGGGEEYHFMSPDGVNQVGKVSLIENGSSMSIQKFELSFPIDSEAKMKAVMISVLFQIVYEIYLTPRIAHAQ